MKIMLKRILSLSLICFILAMPMFAMAEETTSGITGVKTEYNRETRVLSIGAVAPSGSNTEEPARLIILKPAGEGETAEDVINNLNNGTKTFVTHGVHIDEAELKSDYTFNFADIHLPELSVGDYIIHIAAGDNSYTGIVPIASKDQTLSAMNNVTSSEIMAENIEKYNDVYGLKTGKDSEYALLSKDGKEYVLGNMCSVDYEGDIAKINKRFDTYVELYKAYEGPWGVLQEAVETNSTLLGISLSGYNTLSSSYKAEAVKELVGVKYSDTKAFSDAFDEAVKNARIAEEDAKKNSKGSSSGSGSVSMRAEFPAVNNDNPNTPVVNVHQQNNEIFTDLAGIEWAKDSIYELYTKGIVNGKSQGIFAPTDSLTRAEAIKLVVMAFGGVDVSADADFTDVAKDSWMYAYVATAAKRGIINGIGDGSVGAMATVTRQDFATMVMRAAKMSGMSFDTAVKTEFTDNADISDYALEAVYALKNSGVINGVGENKYMPLNVTSRAQAAKIIAALI